LASPSSPRGGTIARWLSAETLSQKAFLNTFAAAIDYAARLLVGFLINPVLVAGLGTYGYGLWQVLRQLTGYLSPAGGRATQALKWMIASHQSSTDVLEKRRFVGGAILVWTLFLPLLSVLGALLAWLSPGWMGVPDDFVTTARLAMGCLVAQLILTMLADVPRSVLTGENLGYKRMGVSALLVLLGGGLMAGAVHLDLGLVDVAASLLVVALLTGLLFLRVAWRHVSWFGVAWPTRELVRRFLGLSWWFLAWHIVMQVMRASDLVLLGLLASLETVTTYSLTRFVPETLIGGVQIVVLGITPGLGGILGRGEIARARRVRSEIMVLTWLVTTVAGTTMLVWNRSFVGLWVGAEHYAGSLPMLLILLMVTQFVMIRNDAIVIDLMLDLRNKVLLGGLSAALSVMAAVLLMDRLGHGIVGLCLGMLAGRSILSMAYPWMVGERLDAPPLQQLRGILRPAGAAALVLWLGFELGDRLVVNSWPRLVLGVATTGILASILAFFVGLSGSQRQRVWARLQR
jgi:O-antigen/teichoic acid export membrane protein